MYSQVCTARPDACRPARALRAMTLRASGERRGSDVESKEAEIEKGAKVAVVPGRPGRAVMKSDGGKSVREGDKVLRQRRRQSRRVLRFGPILFHLM